ncbi:hypothetical protein GRI38_12845 [Altererythrobacter aurantiacus]|uniref:PDZ domain-containing protein n=1 Tax=Parapontixanthobacter aurantiacus TaxID=1463599 RepID=A0A844ZIF0_9SPHN|nr:PDZ domain-containing protein [Parapontixanthobacter aurantiacus]MXO86916.1 hypothetical protein [Parapontixanthobacter aurantiacus]
MLALAPVAASAQAPAKQADTQAAVTTWQAREARLFSIGWKLVTGNAAFCENAEPAAGFLLHDAATYSDADGVRRALGLSGDIAVQAVAAGSPADRAGLQPNDTIHSINEVMVERDFPFTEPAWQRLEDVRAAIGEELALSRPAIIGWQQPDGTPRGEALSPVQACPTWFELRGKGTDAMAEGRRVIFGYEFPGFAYAEPELAAAIAHELAHNLLGHRKWLDAAGRKRSNVRATEREADRLMPWLLANAGYSPRAAQEFMTRWGPRHDGGLLRKRTHDGWDERAKFIAAEIALIEPLLAETGSADWRWHFRRDVAPLRAN